MESGRYRLGATIIVAGYGLIIAATLLLLGFIVFVPLSAVNSIILFAAMAIGGMVCLVIGQGLTRSAGVE